MGNPNVIMGEKMHQAALEIVDLLERQQFSKGDVLKIYCILIATKIRANKAITPDLDTSHLIAEILAFIIEIVNGDYDK